MRPHADLTDKFVGRYIRVHRTTRNLSQEQLGQALGVSSREIEQYETGASRVGAGRLAQIAKFLEMPIGAFFGAPPVDTSISNDEAFDLLDTPYARQILRALSRIEDLALRHKLAVLTEDIADQSKD